jgi:hypothetical protein
MCSTVLARCKGTSAIAHNIRCSFMYRLSYKWRVCAHEMSTEMCVQMLYSVYIGEMSARESGQMRCSILLMYRFTIYIHWIAE